MTIGIYALYWAEQDLVYVGQSHDIEKRAISHLSNMRLHQHSNYKVQEAYNTYSMPSIVVLEVCNVLELDRLEIYWTKEFDALNPSNGLCIIEPGAVGRGTQAPSSKYSRIQILKVFSLLYKAKLSTLEIENRTKVSKSNIKNILCGSSHIWLKEDYPVEYLEMSNRGTIATVTNSSLYKKLGKLPVVVSPSGIPHKIHNIREFCKTLDIDNTTLHALITAFTSLIYGRRTQYKGWVLEN